MFKRIGLITLILLGFIANISHAVEISYLEESFVRGTGTPVTDSVLFTGVAGPALLRVHNGADDDSYEKVSSSIISINGIDVATPEVFNQNVNYLEVPVTLIDGENSLAVQLKSKPGGIIRVSIVQEIDAEAAAMIGPDGGKIQTGSGITLEIPPASLTKDELITATLESEDNFKNGIVLENNQKAISIVNFGTDGLEFERSVLATFPLDVQVSPGTTLPIFVYDSTSDSFVDTDWDCTVTDDGYHCRGEVNHFSKYLIPLPSTLDKLWYFSYAWFADEKKYGYRLPNDTRSLDNPDDVYFRYDKTEFGLEIAKAKLLNSVFLYSSVPEEEIHKYSEREPVLFIHGYQKKNAFGGGNLYWGNFHKLIQNVNNNGQGYIAFDFQWRTNSRFQDVAEDLFVAVEKIFTATGNKKVHIVAHSFGGILARTMLQGLFSDNISRNAGQYVASLTTLGTPHSGIADEEKILVGTNFPRGQDTATIFDFADQITVHQMGESTLHNEPPYLQEKIDAGDVGEIAFKLANLNIYPLPEDLPIQVAIGLHSIQPVNLIDTYRLGYGDRLISYHGQRFHPGLTVGGIKPLLFNQNSFRNTYGTTTNIGANVTEILLGLEGQDLLPSDGITPSSYPSFENSGFTHSIGLRFYPHNFIESYVECNNEKTCNHASFLAVKDWLNKHSTNDEPYCIDEEICGDGKDNNCDGQMDEECLSDSGDRFSTWPDTGQTKCYDNTSEIPCPAPGEPFYGQDAQYAGPSRSYTVLGSGEMVQDNVTGLVWEMKNNMDDTSDYSNPHDADNTYTWCDTNPETNGGDEGICGDYDSEEFIGQLNNSSFGGYIDWRLPTIKELFTLIDPGSIFPAFNSIFASTTKRDHYRSSTTYAGYSGYAWVVSFEVGNGGNGNKSTGYYVRAVRGGQVQPEDRLVDNQDGTVTDNVTCLQWQKATMDTVNGVGPDTYNWQDALAAAENLSLAGYSDWRLPNKNELRSLVDYSRYYPAIAPVFAETTQWSNYWSSTTITGNYGRAWLISFYIGYDYLESKTSDYYVRAVRGQQCGNIGATNQ